MASSWPIILLDPSSAELVLWVLKVLRGVHGAFGQALNEDSRYVTCHLVETCEVDLLWSLEKLGMRRCCINEHYFFAKLCSISLQIYAMFPLQNYVYFSAFALTYFFNNGVQSSLFEMMVSNCPTHILGVKLS